MSTMENDERSLLEAIRKEIRSDVVELIPYEDINTSYMHKSITALILDSWKMAPRISGQRVTEITVEDLHFSSYDYMSICIVMNKGDKNQIANYANATVITQIEHVCSAENDEHARALSLLRILRLSVPPHSIIYLTMKFILVGPLAAFAVAHGVWLLVVEFIRAKFNEEDIKLVLKRVERLFISLKELPENPRAFYLYISILSSSITRVPLDNWESMGSLYILINAMCEVVSATLMFFEDVRKFILDDMKAEFDSLMTLSVYWVTRGVFACSSECNKLPKNGFVIQDSVELLVICNKLIDIHKRLKTLEDTAKLYMDDEKIANAYQIPKKDGNNIYHAIRALFGIQTKKSDLMVTRTSGKNVDLSEVFLKCNTLVLLISGLDISSNVISFLKDIYIESRTSLEHASSKFIWLPIHNGPQTKPSEEEFSKLFEMIPWYSVNHSYIITESTKRFIRDVWKFYKKPIMVVINEKGEVVCPNAIHMMYIWRIKAFPFTRMRERTLWKDEKNINTILFGADHAHILSMLKDSKWVILCGGMDAKWMEEFITCIRSVSVDTNMSIEMIYVGKNEKIQKKISTLLNTPQSSSLDSWYFWTRLESLLISRYQTIAESNYTSDPIILEVQRLLSYASAKSWACLCLPSSDIIIHGLGEVMLQGFIGFDSWRQHHNKSEFAKIFQIHIEQLKKQASDHACSRIVLHIDNKDVVKYLACPDCNYFMEKKIKYICCHANDEPE